MSVSEEKELFSLRRFEEDQNFFLLYLYFPIGLLLLTFRLVVYVTIYPLVTLLPRSSSIRLHLLKWICRIFGIFVKDKSAHNTLHPSAKVLLSNHITLMDHMVLDSIFHCRKMADSSRFNEIYSLSELPVSKYNNRINCMREEILLSSDAAVTLIFPEGARTNGKYGVMKFETWPFELSVPLQSVTINLAQLSWLKISPTVIGAKVWSELCWCFFRPYSVFTFCVLPLVKTRESESSEFLGKKVQFFMAHSSGLIPTSFSLKDKEEYENRIKTLFSKPGIKISPGLDLKKSSVYPPHMIKQARQVQSITPDVPLDIVLSYIELTGSTYKAAIKLLEDKLSDSNISDPHLLDEVLSSSTISSSSFGKTSKIRMVSFQDKKNALLLAAKLRYMKKQMSDS